MSSDPSRFGLLVSGIYRLWRRQVDIAYKELGLSDATRMPIVVLYDHGQAMRQKELAEALAMDTSSLVRILYELREKALVDWCSDPMDRRAKCITLTPAGLGMGERIVRISRDIEERFVAELDQADLATTRATLGLLLQKLKQNTL